MALVSKMKWEDVASFCEDRIQLCREAEAIAGDDTVAADDARTLSIQIQGFSARDEDWRM
jgi:hypothetical protein